MKMYDKQYIKGKMRARSKGFTLVELLVALMVMSVVLAAVASLAFALGTANDISNDTAEKQAQLRYATLRISETLKYCKSVCGTPGNDLAIWINDGNGNEKIEADELVYLVVGEARDYIKLVEFSDLPGWFTSQILQDQIDDLSAIWCRDELLLDWANPAIELIPQCSNANFKIDVQGPQTEFVGINFDLQENGVASSYRIDVSLRCRAGYLVD